MRRTLIAVVSALLFTTYITDTAAAVNVCSERKRVCPQTAGDQWRGAIVTGGVTFPDLSENRDAQEVKRSDDGCDDCEWSVVPACVAAEGGSVDVGCLGARVGCASPSDMRMRVYMRRPGGPWELQGTVCRGAGEPAVDAPDVGAAVREEVAKYLPDASPSFQPRAGGIVNLPTIFQAGEPGKITTESFDVLGFSVVVTAQARWEWTFDDGVVKEFAEPGGTYPDMSVSHTYQDRGPRQVSVTTFWRGQFTLNGEGPFPVPGPEISKTSEPFTVPVRQARAELVAG